MSSTSRIHNEQVEGFKEVSTTTGRVAVKWVILGEDSMQSIQSKIAGCGNCDADHAWTRISSLVDAIKPPHWTRRYFYLGSCPACGSLLTEQHYVNATASA